MAHLPFKAALQAKQTDKSPQDNCGLFA